MIYKKILEDLRLRFQPLKKKVIKNSQRGLGVYEHEETVYLYYSSITIGPKYNISYSNDGFSFQLKKMNLIIDAGDGLAGQFTTVSKFKIYEHPLEKNHFSLLFLAQLGYKNNLNIACSRDLIHWRRCKKINNIDEPGSIVKNYLLHKNFIMYFGSKNISLAYSTDGTNWKISTTPVLSPRENYFDKNDLEIENAFLTDKGILVIYHNKNVNGPIYEYSVGAALFDKNNPEKLLWRTRHPIWKSTKEWRGVKVSPIGVVLLHEKLISYWDVGNEAIYAVVYSFFKLHIPTITQNVSLNLERSHLNPILAPQNENHWESFNVFNPATIYEAGKVHIFYRAQGYDYVSTVGYASSKDGITVDERLDKPIFTPQHHLKSKKHRQPNLDPFSSGGGFGGCEDPRVTIIDDRLYMVYVANDGNLPRLALTSISVKDFLAKRWFWETPVLISPPGVVDKSGCILPEKINGKYVIFHRIFPNILIDFVDSLDFKGYTWLKGEFSIDIRKNKWDSLKIGIGAPPIKTKDGWLLIYYDVDDKDGAKYKIGAMLLDLNNPVKVLHRTDAPILEPLARYENEGFKPGIAYPCGAVVIKETLFVYYGGADSVVCVATANLDHFLSELKHSEIAKLEPAIIKRIL